MDNIAETWLLKGIGHVTCRDCIVFLTAFLCFRLLQLRVYTFKSRLSFPHLLPCPPGLPFFGNMFSFREDMRDILNKWTNEVGGIFRLKVGPLMDVVVVNDIKSIREAFIEKADAFSDRIIPPLIGVAIGSRGSLIWPTNNGWNKTRKFGHKGFRNLGLGKTSMEDKIIAEGNILVKMVEMNEGKPFNPKVLIANAVGNVISRVMLGCHFEYNDPVFERIVGNLELMAQNISLTSASSAFPFLYYTPLCTNFRRPMKEMTAYIKSVVQEHKRDFDPLNIRDIIDLCIAEVKQRSGGSAAEEVVVENFEWRLVLEIYLAGMGTTSDSLMWAILILAQQPKLMAEIQREIDDVIGDERSPKLADQDSMPLCVATLREVSRIRPVVPLGLPRCTSRDVTVQGYHIPKDTVVLMNLWEVLNSRKYWTKPEEFNPYRFLSDDHKTLVDHSAFIPFGIGLRTCLGEKLARMQLFIIFTSLLQKFTFRLADNSLSVGMEGKAGLTFPPHSYNVIFTKRFK